MLIANRLITGGYGLVGSQFQNGIKISSKSDLRNKSIVKNLFELYNPKEVIHLAAKVGGVGANMKANAKFYYDNVMMNTNVIEACRNHGVERAAIFLSTCVFPDKVEYPLTEDKIHLGPGHPSNYGYSYAKRMAEVQVRSYNEQYGTKYFCIIPCNIYGPGDNFSLESGHVIPALIHKVYLAKELNKPYIEVWGDGSPLREFIYSKDVAEITDKLINTDFTGNIIVSNPTEITIKSLVEYICVIMKYKGEIRWQLSKPNGQLKKPSSNSKLISIIGDYHFTSLEKGLRETIKWFEDNYYSDNIRK